MARAKKLLHYIFPQEFFDNPAYFRALTLGVVYVFFLILQLFTFERFPAVFARYGLPFVGEYIAFFVTIVELAALPSLLSMRLSRLAWNMSRAAVLGVAFLWTALTLVAAMTGYNGNVGLLGATLEVTNSWWQLMYMAILSLTAVLLVREVPHRANETKPRRR